jgi:hypothetical protein
VDTDTRILDSPWSGDILRYWCRPFHPNNLPEYFLFKKETRKYVMRMHLTDAKDRKHLRLEFLLEKRQGQ